MFNKEGILGAESRLTKESLKFRPVLLSLFSKAVVDRFVSYIPQHDKENVVEAKFSELERDTCGIASSISSSMALKNNTDLLVCKAEYYHQCGEYQKCFGLVSA